MNLRMQISHFFGGVLLIVGTTVGAGIIGLPVDTSPVGFFPSLILLFGCWLLMLATAYFFLDVNMSIQGEPNLISMARCTLGRWGQGLSWIVYLLLLYSLTAAYIALSAKLFSEGYYFVTGSSLPSGLACFLLPLVFGGFIYLGTEGVDLINRVMMIGLVVTYFLLILFLPEKVQVERLFRADFRHANAVLPVIIVSFGYHIIIPSLVTYMNHNKKKLRWVLFVGSLIPLIFYVVWQLLTMGAIPFTGEAGFQALLQRDQPVTEALVAVLQSTWIQVAAGLFSFFVVVTSFLGVTLSLSDFLMDGLRIKKSWEGKLGALALTFLPPLFFVLTYERGFYLALRYGGVFVAVLLIFLPALMAWKLKKPTFYRTIWGRLLLSVAMVSAGFVIITSIQRAAES